MDGKNGNQKVIEQLVADGFQYMFGNPGTVEQGFLDALADYPKIQYVLSHQESIAVLMADGYARATNKPALVQLHSSPGIGNAVGALYQAKRGHSPLVVIAGDSGVKYLNMDAQMAADLVAIMEPVTKYATVVYHKDSILRTLRRAIKIAYTPPMGPVYVCLPLDILSEINTEEVFPTHFPDTKVLPSSGTIQKFAEILLSAKHPMIFMGDGVGFSNAVEELTNLAELLGAEIHGVDVGNLNMDTTHPCYIGTTGHMFGFASKPITEKGDVNLIVGTYMLPEVFPELGSVFSENAKVLHIDLDSYEIAKNHRVDMSIVADPKLTLKAIYAELSNLITEKQKNEANDRINSFKSRKKELYDSLIKKDELNKGKQPLFMSEFMEKLANKLPSDAIIFDEALTNSPAVTRYFPPKNPGSYFVTRGGSLGVGFPGALGVKFANPDRLVIGFSGDGGSMYTIQALASAKRHKKGVKFVVCNNSSYRLLQLNITQYWNEMNISGREFPVPFDLSVPDIRFDILAKSFGVESVRVSKPEEIDSAIEQMLSKDEPFLIDYVLEGNAYPELVGVKCGQ
jgi:benzoylformate decarboxylase